MISSNHPSETDLALYSGDDLDVWNRWRIRRHVTGCASCRHEVQAYRDAVGAVHNSAGRELPTGLNWNRLSQEMTGNIRVGFAAGECIAGFEKTLRPARPRLLWHTALVILGVCVVSLATLMMNLSNTERKELLGSLDRVRFDRFFQLLRSPAVPSDTVVLEAGPQKIEVVANGRTLTLIHPHSEEKMGATVSVNMQDSAGVRYVDADSDQVTTNRVYYAQ